MPIKHLIPTAYVTNYVSQEILRTRPEIANRIQFPKSNKLIQNFGQILILMKKIENETENTQCFLKISGRENDDDFPHCQNIKSAYFPDLDVSYSSGEPYKAHTPDFYFPFFTLIEFFCYMGWIKVAETLLNPFGDDDEDFQVNYIITRNLQVHVVLTYIGTCKGVFIFRYVSRPLLWKRIYECCHLFCLVLLEKL